MTSEAVPVVPVAAGKTKPPKIVVPRHRLMVRLTHWTNVVALSVMLLTGLNIFDAHPALYWGQYAHFDHPWLSLTAAQTRHGLEGVTQIGPLKFDTTGVLGASQQGGMITARGFPSWATLPHMVDLADARTWHFFWAWVFVINGLIYVLTGLINRHLVRDLVPHPRDIKNLWRDIVDHARLHFAHGREALRYGPLQRIAYASIALIILPVIVLTGMTMSPSLDAAFPFLVELFGGRQSARSIHFICAALAVGFIVIHLVMVLLTGPLNQLRGMITGKFAIVDEDAAHD